MRCESTPSNGESRPALHETGSRRGPVPFVEDGAELLREALLQAADDGAREIESRWPAALARRDAGGALRLQGVPLAHGGFQHGRQALQSPRQPEIPCGPVAVARRNAGHAHEFLGFHILGFLRRLCRLLALVHRDARYHADELLVLALLLVAQPQVQ